MNSVVSRWLHEEVPGVRDVPRQGRSGGGVGGRQVDLPFLVPHPAWEVPVRSGHADLHPGYQIHMLNSSHQSRTCQHTRISEYLFSFTD